MLVRGCGQRHGVPTLRSTLNLRVRIGQWRYPPRQRCWSASASLPSWRSCWRRLGRGAAVCCWWRRRPVWARRGCYARRAGAPTLRGCGCLRRAPLSSSATFRSVWCASCSSRHLPTPIRWCERGSSTDRRRPRVRCSNLSCRASRSGRTGGSGDPSFATLHGLYWFVANLVESGPALVAVDDAHWADSASLGFLAFLLPRLEDLPVLLVLALRPEEPDAAAGLARLRSDPVGRRWSPAPLSAEAVAQLVQATLGSDAQPAFCSTCHEVSGGNPFLLGELTAALEHDGVAGRASDAPLVRRARAGGSRARHAPATRPAPTGRR